MRILQRAWLVATVLVAAVAIGAARHKPASAEVTHLESATLAGGCFWGLQETLRKIPGVIKTTAGYTGGMTPDPTYELVAGGKTGHQEAVAVMFDPARVSYEEVLSDFLMARTPARLAASTNNPHPPVIFYHGEQQRQAALLVSERIRHSQTPAAPFIVEITPATTFYPAEAYHQDYYQKNAAAQACSRE